MKIKLLGLKDYIWLFMMILIFPPSFIQVYSSIYRINLIIQCVVAVLLGTIIIIRKKYDMYFIFIVLFYCIQLMSTLVQNNVYALSAFREILCALSIIFSVFYIIKTRKKRVLDNLNILLTVYIFLNFILTLVAPDMFGVYESRITQSLYFLGVKNQMALVLVPMLAYIMVYRYWKFQKKDIVTFVILGMGLITEYVIDSSTGYISVFLMMVIYVLYGRLNRKVFQFRNIMLGYFFANILLIFLQVILETTFIRNVVESVLHRDITFSNRTAIWAQALLRFTEAPWVGLGRQEGKQMITFGAMNIWDTASHFSTHNTFLQTMLESGVIGLIPLIVVFILLVRKNKEFFCDLNCVIVLGISGLLVTFLAEAYDWTYFFALGCMVYEFPLFQLTRNRPDMNKARNIEKRWEF